MYVLLDLLIWAQFRQVGSREPTGCSRPEGHPRLVPATASGGACGERLPASQGALCGDDEHPLRGGQVAALVHLHMQEEAVHWQVVKPVTKRLRTALRIDNFLKGDWQSISKALEREGLPETLDGAKDSLND